MTPPQLPLAPPTWESLPPTRQQELTQLLATLLTQYLTAHKAAHKAAHKRQTTNQPLEESDHERTPQNP